jgi:hypothetical protein
MLISMLPSGALASPHSKVSFTTDADELCAYNQISSIDEVPLTAVWIVVPAVAVSTTLIALPLVDPLRSVFVKVAMMLSLSEYL